MVEAQAEDIDEVKWLGVFLGRWKVCGRRKGQRQALHSYMEGTLYAISMVRTCIMASSSDGVGACSGFELGYHLKCSLIL